MRNPIRFLLFLSIFNVAHAASHNAQNENERQWDRFLQTNQNVRLVELDNDIHTKDGKWKNIVIAGEYIDFQDVLVLNNIPTAPYPLSEVGGILITNTGFKDASLLSSITRAESITIMEPEFNNLDGLASLKESESINISQGQLSQLRGLSKLEKAGLLLFSGNKIKSLKGMDSLKEVEIIDINFNQVQSLEPLEGVKKIKEITATNNNIKSMKGIENAEGVTSVALMRNKLTSVDNIPLSKTMDNIILENNFIENLSGLKEKKVKIRVINLRNNPVRSVAGIENFEITESFILDKNYRGVKLKGDTPFCTSITEQIDKLGIKSGGAKKSQYCL